MPVKKPNKAGKKPAKQTVRKVQSPKELDADVLMNNSTGRLLKSKALRRTLDDLGEHMMQAPRKYDWPMAREIYMTSQPAITLKQLAMQTGIPYQQVRNRSTKERWSAIRAQEQLAKLKEARQDFQRKMAKEAITFDETSIDVAKLGQGIIAGRLIEISRLLEAAGNTTAEVIAKLKSGEPLQRGDLYSIVNYKELASLAQAAIMFQQIGRTALGTEVIDGTLLNESNADLEQVVSIGGELTKDDPKRLASFLEALERANLTVLNVTPVTDADEEDTDSVQVLEGTFTEVKQIEGGPDGQ